MLNKETILGLNMTFSKIFAFEHYFDKAFDLCKGKYKIFYDEIENLGRCVYRRYQIWISNKMFCTGK